MRERQLCDIHLSSCCLILDSYYVHILVYQIQPFLTTILSLPCYYDTENVEGTGKYQEPKGGGLLVLE